jgi:ribosomal protein L7/L12
MMQAAKEQRAKQEQRAQSLVAQLADPLRAEIVALAKQGQRIDAIKRYAAASGEDLSTAKQVIDLLVPR